MKTCIQRPHKTQPVSGLPLFSWRVVVVQPGTRAGHYVARRYRVHPALRIWSPTWRASEARCAGDLSR